VRDAELVRRLRAGDDSAWEALDRRYRPALERFARRMLHDVAPDQVEDVVQEALWRAHRALRRDTRVLELRPWLYRLTRNCCLDERARVRTDAVELERAAGIADRADGPAATVERRGALRTLLDDLARLPDLQRHALLRRELDGLSHDELAAELGLTTGATRSLVHRARSALTRAAEGRTLGCHDVRPDIFDAYDRRRRPTARTLRHLATCPNCRTLQSALRAQRRTLASLAPPIGLLAALGGGLGLAGWHAKAATVGATAVVAAGVSVELFQAGDPAPIALQSIAVPGKRLAAGAPIPDGVAIVRREVAYPEHRTVALGCPEGLRLADLLPPRGGRVSAHYDATTTIGADQSGRVVLTGAERNVAVTVAALCRRPDASGSIIDPSNARVFSRTR
jgi:RNA polymerase sigma factor (sigma-70 family)